MYENQLVSIGVRELVESLDVEQILPQNYAAYRPLLLDGLCFFLEHLPARHLTTIVSEQLTLSVGSSFADRVLTLLRTCPTLHKLGQVLSPELRHCLQRLESQAPTTRRQDIPTDLLDELDAIAGIEVADQPLAEASVAVVLPFTLHADGSREARAGVFKVLRPGVYERLFGELDIWGELGSFLEERCAHLGLPVLDYRETLDSVRRLLQQEVQFELEQKHLVEAADYYANDPDVVIPRLFPFCSNRVTAMERVDGVKVTDANLDDNARRELADTLVNALIAKPFWDSAELARFHADPHAGNLFYTSDRRLAIFDWTLVGYLDKAQRTDFVQIILGALTLDETRICRAVSHLGRSEAAESQLRECVSVALTEVRQGCFPGFDWSQRLLDRVAMTTGMGFPDNLVLFRKAILTISGVLADISPDYSMDRVMLCSGLDQFSKEVSARFFARPGFRGFGTHVSNADLIELWSAWPGTAVAYWLGFWQDCLEALQSDSATTRATSDK